ncbi:MAG: hypothetical protein R3E50_16645 [Halioglobus sp.]
MLAAEMRASTGKDPQQLYEELEARYGKAYYQRVDAPASEEQKQAIKSLDGSRATLSRLAGEPVESITTTAAGNGASIGGVR